MNGNHFRRTYAIFVGALALTAGVLAQSPPASSSGSQPRDSVTAWSAADFAARIRQRQATALSARPAASAITIETKVPAASPEPTEADFLRDALAARLAELRSSNNAREFDWYPTLGMLSQTTQPSSAPAESGEPKGAEPAGGGESESDLAKKVQNPVANLISVPFQNNVGFGAGAQFDLRFRPRAVLDLLRRRPLKALRDVTLKASDDNNVQNVLNIQPVIPVTLNKDLNVINRFILPLIWQPEVVPNTGETFGMGDLQYTAFFSPAKPSKLIWGVGPVFLFPTATDDVLGTGKWSLGPSFVVLTMDGPWVIGTLGQQIFSFCGESDRPYVSQMLIQPFINYNFDKGWYATFSPIITANWNATSHNQWTVPLGGGVGKIIHIGKLPLNVQISGYYNVDKPDFSPDWTLRAQVQLLFPK